MQTDLTLRWWTVKLSAFSCYSCRSRTKLKKSREQRATGSVREEEKMYDVCRWLPEIGEKMTLEGENRSLKWDKNCFKRFKENDEQKTEQWEWFLISDWSFRPNKTVQTREGEQRGDRQMGGWNTKRKNLQEQRAHEERAKREGEWKKTAAEGVGKQAVWSRLMSRHKTEWQSKDGN